MSPRPKKDPKKKCRFESLERRALMSASPNAAPAADTPNDPPLAVATPDSGQATNLRALHESQVQALVSSQPPFNWSVQNGVLKIQATESDRRIRVITNSNTLVILPYLWNGSGSGGQSTAGDRVTVPLNGIRKIEFHGTSGNDYFINDTNLPSLAYGYKGGDVFLGGTNSDEFHGGAGNDHLDGRNGNDTVLGGKGDDVLNGGRDRDVVKGGAGFDRATPPDSPWDTQTGIEYGVNTRSAPALQTLASDAAFQALETESLEIDLAKFKRAKLGRR